jgi:hypothetical protein
VHPLDKTKNRLISDVLEVFRVAWIICSGKRITACERSVSGNMRIRDYFGKSCQRFPGESGETDDIPVRMFSLSAVLYSK